MTSERDAYEVLQVSESADQEVVHAAYRALARRYHPDRAKADPARMVEINRAYAELRTAARRAAYDGRRRSLARVGPGTQPGRPTWAPTPQARPSEAAGPSASPNPSAGPSLGPLGRRLAVMRDDTTIDFGRYAGWRIGELARHDPDYLRWLCRHSMGFRFRSTIAQALGGDRATGRQAALIR